MRRFWVALLAVMMAGSASTASADDLIVGGGHIDIERVPWMLSLQLDGAHYCGAVLVAPKVALTAAHCTDGTQVHRMSVRAGSSVHAANGHKRAVERVIQHPKYDGFITDYDVSVLRLSTRLPYSDKVSPARVARDVPSTGTETLVTGWGNLTEVGPVPKHLWGVRVPIVDRAKCRESYGDEAVTSRMICAGFEEGKKDACQGDSGGPLTIDATLVGLVSWGHGCARPTFYGVYTNVAHSSVRAWIERYAGV